MKHFDNLKMVLFDSSSANANFRLAVEVQFTRLGPDGNTRDLVYTTDKGTSVLNPNIYLTFCYKDEQMTSVYTSYPQLYRIRRAFRKVKDDLESGNAFFTDPNTQELTVKQTFEEPVIVDNIGKKNNWIQLKIGVMKSGENGVYTYAPGVSLTLSTSNGYASVLSEEEFYTLYTIIEDLDLSTLQCMASLGFLNADPRVINGYNGGGYPQWQYQTTPGFNGGNQSQMQPPMNGNWAGRNQGNYQRPNYGSQPRQNSYRTTTNPNQTSYNAATQQTVSPADRNTYSAYSQPVPQAQPQMQPREASKPIMSPRAVDETPVSQYDIDDAAAIDNIFNS